MRNFVENALVGFSIFLNSLIIDATYPGTGDIEQHIKIKTKQQCLIGTQHAGPRSF